VWLAGLGNRRRRPAARRPECRHPVGPRLHNGLRLRTISGSPKVEICMSAKLAQVTAILLVSLAACSPAVSDPPNIAGTSINQDELDVYEAVLASWLQGARTPQMVAEQLDKAPTLSDPEKKNCGSGLSFVAPGDDRPGALAGVQFRKARIKLVDGTQWKWRDPADAIRKGTSVDAAVKEGFAHSLIRLSRVAFTPDRQDALVAFGMTCGSLCGSGSTVHLHKKGSVWSIVERCSQWLS